MTRLFAIGITAFFIFFTLLYMSSPLVEFPAEAPGSITFIGNAGNDNVFTVNNWKFETLEHLEDPEHLHLVAILDMASITCEWKELESSLHKKKDYFYSKKFNTAKVIVTGAAKAPDGSYLAQAQLTLKGVTREVPIRFTLTGDGPYELEADANIFRRNFRFTGDGPNDEVPVKITATLE